MISKQMYKILKNIPHAPAQTTFMDLNKKRIVDINLLKNLLENALKDAYIAFPFRNSPYNDILQTHFSLTELGQTAVEEYLDKHSSAKRGTIALVISGLSLLVSIVAVIVSLIS